MQRFSTLTLTVLLLFGCSGEHSCGIDPDSTYYVTVQINEGPDSGKFTYVSRNSVDGLESLHNPIQEWGTFSKQFRGKDIQCFEGGVRIGTVSFHLVYHGRYTIKQTRQYPPT